MIDAQFGHVNLVARDWRRLADFYIRVLRCVFVPPERDHAGPALAAGTADPEGNLVDLQAWSEPTNDPDR